MPWIITQDLIAEEGEESCVGFCSYNFPSDLDPATLPYEFRLVDGDGGVYYHGRSSDSSSFGPLDDFGTGWAGCTEIQYLENGHWQPL